MKWYEVYASCYVLNKFVIEIRQRKSRVILHECRDLLLVVTMLGLVQGKPPYVVLFQFSGK